MYYPAKYHLKIVKAASFDLPMTWKDSSGNPVNLNGWTASLPIIDKDGTSVRTLSTVSGEIVLASSAVSPNITLSMTAATTASFTFGGGASYELLLTDTIGKITRLLNGPAILL